MLSLAKRSQRDCGKLCWICVDGKVVQATAGRPDKRRQMYPSQEERRRIGEALLGLLDGKVVQLTEAEARDRGIMLPPRRKRKGMCKTLLGRLEDRSFRFPRLMPRRKACLLRYPGRSEEEL